MTPDEQFIDLIKYVASIRLSEIDAEVRDNLINKISVLRLAELPTRRRAEIARAIRVNVFGLRQITVTEFACSEAAANAILALTGCMW